MGNPNIKTPASITNYLLVTPNSNSSPRVPGTASDISDLFHCQNPYSFQDLR